MINLDNNDYKLYQTEYKDDIDLGRAEEGIFYVPGLVTTSMDSLYETDDYARENDVVGIKIQVKDGKISVLYQESPKDLCQLQSPTSSPLTPIVCLPNELVINVVSDETLDVFVPDSVLE